jgi:hypothetical protein
MMVLLIVGFSLALVLFNTPRGNAQKSRRPAGSAARVLHSPAVSGAVHQNREDEDNPCAEESILLVAGSLVLQSALHLELMNRGVNVKNVLTGERSQESRSRKRSAAACRSRRGYSGANQHGVLLT